MIYHFCNSGLWASLPGKQEFQNETNDLLEFRFQYTPAICCNRLMQKINIFTIKMCILYRLAVCFLLLVMIAWYQKIQKCVIPY